MLVKIAIFNKDLAKVMDQTYSSPATGFLFPQHDWRLLDNYLASYLKNHGNELNNNEYANEEFDNMYYYLKKLTDASFIGMVARKKLHSDEITSFFNYIETNHADTVKMMDILANPFAHIHYQDQTAGFAIGNRMG